ncbi:hypothetical protein E2C01_056733 [Portunus trituberculatus]|uniref:Uncharacterized protein n=1 Tax=Portunus trituberculatus TaxID=210409 RepID=A0A5B7H1E9_PORTR|nr:hypothetical protein [Portunus trituberculatus]
MGLQVHRFESCPRSECRLGFLTQGNGFLAGRRHPRISREQKNINDIYDNAELVKMYRLDREGIDGYY